MLTNEQLVELRDEIVLGSMFTRDYRNTLGIPEKCVHDFFDSYCDYLEELAEEDGVEDEYGTFDTADNLINWYGCYADYDPLPVFRKERSYEVGDTVTPVTSVKKVLYETYNTHYGVSEVCERMYNGDIGKVTKTGKNLWTGKKYYVVHFHGTDFYVHDGDMMKTVPTDIWEV